MLSRLCPQAPISPTHGPTQSSSSRLPLIAKTPHAGAFAPSSFTPGVGSLGSSQVHRRRAIQHPSATFGMETSRFSWPKMLDLLVHRTSWEGINYSYMKPKQQMHRHGIPYGTRITSKTFSKGVTSALRVLSGQEKNTTSSLDIACHYCSPQCDIHNFPKYVKYRLLLHGTLIFLLRKQALELCHTRNQAVVFLRAHQSVCFFLVAFLESSHDLGRFGASRLRFWRGHGFRIGYISVGRMGPRVDLPALDFVPF